MATQAALPRLRLAPMQGPLPPLEVPFDPATLVVAKPVPWAQAPTSVADQPELVFGRAQGRQLSVLLRLKGTAASPSVQPTLDALLALALVTNPLGPEAERHPPLVEITWPPSQALPAFKGAIERLEVRYQAMQANGTPREADVLLQVLEASRLSFQRR